MGRPINNKYFGNGGGKFTVKFHDGAAVVTGKIVSQVGARKFKVAKTDGTGAKICRLATTAAELDLLINGTALAGVTQAELCTIDVNVFGAESPAQNVKSLTANKIVTLQGTTVTYKGVSTATAAGAGTVGSVVEIELTRGFVIVPTGTVTVAGEWVFPLPAGSFNNGNPPLTYSMNTYAGFSINPTTGTITKAAGAGAVGEKNIVITATDADGDSVSALPFTVTVS